MEKADIALIGLAVMGQNLVLNMERNGYQVAVYNRTTQTMREFVAAHPGKKLTGCATLEELVAALDRPRKVMLMVKAGPPVDAVIRELAPLLAPGDLIVDGGNSFFLDTERRANELAAQGLLFLGTGVSGGEEGALWGPSIMPGGQPEAYALVEDIFRAIAAKVDGEPCVTYIGPRGAGHYVKMVHNGIEYADMQLIAEAYDILHRGLRQDAHQLVQIFSTWNRGELNSYLIEITAEVLKQVDAETGKPLVDVIVDRAAQKGTGTWTAQNALELGVPLTGITEAVFARALSSGVAQRAASGPLEGHAEPLTITDRDAFVEDVRQALYASKIVAYSQGFVQIEAAAKEFNWTIDLGGLARIWRGGCIIRAGFLNDITEAYERDENLPLLMADENFASKINACVPAWRRVVSIGATAGIPLPAFGSSLSYYDGLRAERLPAALIQGQRDFFGAHTYLRVDKAGVFHTLWSGDRTEIATAPSSH